MEEEIKIPDERIGVLIGPSGSVKKKLMKKTSTIITIDSGSGDILIEGEGENFVKACDTVKAIGRGFNPEKAFKLLEENFLLKIINIPEFTGKNTSAQIAKKGRIIGKQGLAKKRIEEETNSFISVYGKTVSIISHISDIKRAEEAVELLLKGATHETMENRLKNFGKTRFEL
ncbi:MAG: KH domain-containing protein [Candidatus ainarchaeum sp.]|nr:KH domain-containing protein [Candidatus ainarchaeum sp.]